MKSAAHFPLDKKVQVRLTRLAFATSSASAIAAGVEKAWPLKHGSISRSRLSSLLLRTQKWQPRSVCYKRVLPSTVEPLCTTCDLMCLQAMILVRCNRFQSCIQILSSRFPCWIFIKSNILEILDSTGLKWSPLIYFFNTTAMGVSAYTLSTLPSNDHPVSSWCPSNVRDGSSMP